MASRSKVRNDALPADQIEEILDDLEQQLERCKVLYEQHFLGIQKMPPHQLHKRIERVILQFTQQRISNTALRFRFNNLSQKYGAYNTYWMRTMRQIEQGTYTRHIARAHRRAQAQGLDTPDELLASLPKRLREKMMRDRERLAEREAKDAARKRKPSESQGPAMVRQAKPHFHELDAGDLDDMSAMFAEAEAAVAKPPPAPEPAGDDDDFDLEARFAAITSALPKAPPPKPPPKPPPIPRAPATSSMPSKEQLRARYQQPKPAAAPPPGMTEAQTRQLYNQYVQAQKMVGADTSKVSYDKLMRTLQKQAPAIMKQHNAKAVDFSVVVKDNTVVLKAKPKK